MRPAFFIHGAAPPVKSCASRALAPAESSLVDAHDLPGHFRDRIE